MANTSRSTVVAVYRNNSDAQGAAAELKANGFQSSDIYISAADPETASGGDAETREYSSHHHHEGGITGWFKSLFGHDDDDVERTTYQDAVNSGNVLLSVETDDQKVEAAGNILDRFNPIDIQREDASANVAGADVKNAARDAAARSATAGPGPVTGTTASRNYPATQQTGAAASSTAGTTGKPVMGQTDAQGQAIPVVQEELKVGKRQILRGGVRVYSRLVEQPVEETVRLREENVRVARDRVDRPVTQADLKPGRDQVIEVQEYAEEPVVAKEARVIEEVRIQKDATERDETIRDTVRRTEVRVEGINAENAAGGSPAAQSDFDDDYRRDFQTNYASSGGSYDDYAPAYRYGYQMANDPRYQGRNFDDIESDLRSDYARRYPNSGWDRFKNSIRYGWDRVTGKTKAATSR
jgi:stress response protein YsnF